MIAGKPMRSGAVVSSLFAAAAFRLTCAVAALLAIGCTSYKGGKITEGTDIAAGMSIPQSGGTLQIDALNFVSGFRFLFCENAGVTCKYTTTNTVSAFGVYSSTTVKAVQIELTPTVDEAEDADNANEDAAK